MLVKNTHEALVGQELWDTVQRIRENKRRPPKHMDEPELLWTFIERIDIGERPGRYNRNGMQEVRIIYRDVGVVDSTLSAEDAESTEVHFIPSLPLWK